MSNATYGYTPGSGGLAAVDRVAGADYPYYKLKWGAPDTLNDVTAAAPLPVSQTGNVNIGTMPAISGSVTIASGTVTANAGTGTFTVAGTVTSNQGTPGATAWKVDGTGGSFPVTGTITANAGTGTFTVSGTVTANQGSTWSVRNQDGTGNALTSAARGGERALSVQIVDASGGQVTSFGGGILYTEDVALPLDPSAAALLARRRDTLTASEVSTDGDAIALNANSKGQLYTIAEIPASQLGTAGPLAKSNSTSVTMATDEQPAHDAVDSGNPWKVGGQARTTNPTPVANADRSNFITDKLGKQIAVTAIRERKGAQYTSGIVTAAETPIIFAGGTGVFRDLYGLTLSNTSPNVVSVTIRDMTGGASVMVLVVPPTDTRGLTLDCGSAIPQTTADSQWTATLNAITGGSVHVTALYVENL
jgi:hypothetical protein